MDAAKTQMNVRIDSATKNNGDLVFAAIGTTPSIAIRTLWSFAARHKNDPETVRDILEKMGNETQTFDEAKQAALNNGLALMQQASAITAGWDKKHSSETPDEVLLEEYLMERYEERGLLA